MRTGEFVVYQQQAPMRTVLQWSRSLWGPERRIEGNIRYDGETPLQWSRSPWGPESPDNGYVTQDAQCLQWSRSPWDRRVIILGQSQDTVQQLQWSRSTWGPESPDNGYIADLILMLQWSRSPWGLERRLPRAAAGGVRHPAMEPIPVGTEETTIGPVTIVTYTKLQWRRSPWGPESHFLVRVGVAPVRLAAFEPVPVETGESTVPEPTSSVVMPLR